MHHTNVAGKFDLILVWGVHVMGGCSSEEDLVSLFLPV